MSMNNNPINHDPIDFIEETAAVRIGARIREIRLVRGLTQLELGEKVGLSADRVRQYETGYRKPKTDMIKAIASALEVQPLALTTDRSGSNKLFGSCLCNVRTGKAV